MKISTGDKVRVFDIHGRRRGQPDGGWEGEVVKVGRMLVTIKFGTGQPRAFRMDTGKVNDDYGHLSFLTLEQCEEDIRKVSATQTLQAAGIRLDYRVKYPVDQLEALAALVQSFTDNRQENQA